MSRYLGLKKSFEDIKKRKSTKNERLLLCALSIISKAYDTNFLELREIKEICKKEYGANFIRNMYNIKEEERKKFLWSIPLERRANATKYYEIDYLEKQLFYLSKAVRRGIGLEVRRESLDADKFMMDNKKVARREHDQNAELAKKKWGGV